MTWLPISARPSAWGHFDLPTEYVSSTVMTQEVTITKGDIAFVAGVWYVGIYASSGRGLPSSTSQLSLSRFCHSNPPNCPDDSTKSAHVTPKS